MKSILLSMLTFSALCSFQVQAKVVEGIEFSDTLAADYYYPEMKLKWGG